MFDLFSDYETIFDNFRSRTLTGTEEYRFLLWRINIPLILILNVYKNEYSIRTCADYPQVLVVNNWQTLPLEQRIIYDQIEPFEKIFEITPDVLEFIFSRTKWKNDDFYHLENAIYRIVRLHARFDQLSHLKAAADSLPEFKLSGNKSKLIEYTPEHLFDLVGIIQETEIKKQSTEIHPVLSKLIEDAISQSYRREGDYQTELNQLLRRLYYASLRHKNFEFETKIENILSNDQLFSFIKEGNLLRLDSLKDEISIFDVEYLLESAMDKGRLELIELIANQLKGQLIDLAVYPEGRIMKLIERIFNECDWETCTAIVNNTRQNVKFYYETKVEVEDRWSGHQIHFMKVSKTYWNLILYNNDSAQTRVQNWNEMRPPRYYYPPLVYERFFIEKIEKSADSNSPVSADVMRLAHHSSIMQSEFTNKMNPLSNLSDSLNVIHNLLEKSENPLRLTEIDLKFNSGGDLEYIPLTKLHESLSLMNSWQNPDALNIESQFQLDRKKQQRRKIDQIIEKINFPNIQIYRGSSEQMYNPKHLYFSYNHQVGRMWSTKEQLNYTSEILVREQVHHTRQVLRDESVGERVIRRERTKWDNLMAMEPKNKDRTLPQHNRPDRLQELLQPATSNLFDFDKSLVEGKNSIQVDKAIEDLEIKKKQIQQLGYTVMKPEKSTKNVPTKIKEMLAECASNQLENADFVISRARQIDTMLQMFKLNKPDLVAVNMLVKSARQIRYDCYES